MRAPAQLRLSPSRTWTAAHPRGSVSTQCSTTWPSLLPMATSGPPLSSGVARPRRGRWPSIWTLRSATRAHRRQSPLRVATSGDRQRVSGALRRAARRAKERASDALDGRDGLADGEERGARLVCRVALGAELLVLGRKDDGARQAERRAGTERDACARAAWTAGGRFAASRGRRELESAPSRRRASQDGWPAGAEHAPSESSALMVVSSPLARQGIAAGACGATSTARRCGCLARSGTPALATVGLKAKRRARASPAVRRPMQRSELRRAGERTAGDGRELADPNRCPGREGSRRRGQGRVGRVRVRGRASDASFLREARQAGRPPSSPAFPPTTISAPLELLASLGNPLASDMVRAGVLVAVVGFQADHSRPWLAPSSQHGVRRTKPTESPAARRLKEAPKIAEYRALVDDVLARVRPSLLPSADPTRC